MRLESQYATQVVSHHAGTLEIVSTASSRRERKKDQTRLTLTRSALKLFREQGFEATTVEEIAEAADFHRATFFRLFASKGDVAFGDIADRLKAARTAFEENADAEDLWATARDVIIRESTRFASSDPELQAAYVALWATDPGLQQRFSALMTEWERAVAQFFATAWGVDANHDIDCQTIGTAIIGVSRSSMLVAHATGRPIQDLLDAGYRTLAAGLTTTISGRNRDRPTA